MSWASLIAQLIKNLPAMEETWTRLLAQEDPLEMEMATHLSILAWRFPGTEEPGRLQSTGLQELDIAEQLNPITKQEEKRVTSSVGTRLPSRMER